VELLLTLGHLQPLISRAASEGSGEEEEETENEPARSRRR
jgi:hypothetical protein